MKHSGIITVVCLALAGALPVGAGADVLISVPNIDSGAEDLEVTSIGATTASTVGFGNYVVGPGDVSTWARPIVQFPVSSFSSLAGLSVVSATLHYSILRDFTEPGEFGTSDVRLFTTGETELSYANRNVFAGLSGDGGAHTVVGSASFIDGVTGAQSLVFSAAALIALEAAINGVDPTLVIAFREFAVSNPVDSLTPLDEFVLGVPPGNMSIEITAVPEPATLALLAMGGLALISRRRNRQRRHECGDRPNGANDLTNEKWKLTSRITRVVALVVFVAVLAQPTVTQAGSFNIDFGSGPAPSSSYGAAAGQPGFWNVVASDTFSLKDIAGNSTGVTLVSPSAPWPDSFDHPGTSGDDQFLLDDFMAWPPTGPIPFTLVGLPAGPYQFISYSFAPNGANSSVDIAGSPEGFQLLGGAWPGSHQLGVTYALHTVTLAQPGDVTVTVGVWNGVWGGFNGLQIVQIPEPATLSLLALGGLGLIRRGRTQR